MSALDLEEIKKASNPERAIHLFIFEKYSMMGYENTQEWMRHCWKNWKGESHDVVAEYFKNRIEKNKQFEPYKKELLQLVLALNPRILESWVDQRKEMGLDKKTIYEILSELFVCVQYHPITKNKESTYDLVADFLDRFTVSEKRFKILPDEPDCK